MGVVSQNGVKKCHHCVANHGVDIVGKKNNESKPTLGEIMGFRGWDTVIAVMTVL